MSHSATMFLSDSFATCHAQRSAQNAHPGRPPNIITTISQVPAVTAIVFGHASAAKKLLRAFSMAKKVPRRNCIASVASVALAAGSASGGRNLEANTLPGTHDRNTVDTHMGASGGAAGGGAGAFVGRRISKAAGEAGGGDGVGPDGLSVIGGKCHLVSGEKAARANTAVTNQCCNSHPHRP